MTDPKTLLQVVRARAVEAHALGEARLHRRAERRSLVAVGLLGLFVACGDDSTSGPNEVPVRFIVSNALVAPITIAVDGTPYVILSSGRSTGLTVSSAARLLTWTSSKPTDFDARPIADDIGEVKIALASVGAALEITNVIDGQTYVTAGIFNYTPARVSIGVSDASSVSCAGLLRAASGGTRGFVQIGYYRLLPTTEIRAYRDESSCTGPYVAWPRSQLDGFTARSGLLALSLNAAP